MRDKLLAKSKLQNNQTIIISGSKSETNRLLLLQALYPNLKIENASNADDTLVMQKALQSVGKVGEINVHHAGTAMRFLTAFFAVQDGLEVTLSGSDRMHERPIKILVDALKQLGCNISYLKEEGFPPIKIIGKIPQNNNVLINANVSSQYITALMLVGASLPNGLQISLQGTITSLPYISMSLQILQELGIQATFQKSTIQIPPTKQLSKNTFVVESDWSSASYFYSFIALSPIGTQISLGYFKQNSLQGDASLVEIYKQFGVQTTFNNNKIIVKKVQNHTITNIDLNLNNTPDIAQTIIVTCLGLGITCNLTGLHTLIIKETNRLQALKTELQKFNAKVSITNNSIQLLNTNSFAQNVVEIDTYNDHRMAMAFAPLALQQQIVIKNANVVTKSYPNFWSDIKSLLIDI